MPLIEAEQILEVVQAITLVRVGTSPALLDRAWEIATLLGQSDVFDSLGYAVAEAEGAEFWTSDRRFANATAGRLAGVRLAG